ncbi:AMP-dependent synthetase [Cupriavidus pauculus]|uniref:AMP-dependent synthetase n=2 Tax=Cupriavidus pauculus TaxID=82633 RepID=A0A2N5CAP2_9BURK|nr:AMP-dependent synthetase [Cupriavidus pauculus]
MGPGGVSGVSGVAGVTGVTGAMSRLATQAGAADFVARVAGWRQAFAAQAGQRWALYLDQPEPFAAALLGAWHAGKQVVLPGDNRAETLAALRDTVDGLAGDLPEGLQAEAGLPGAEPAFDWPPLSPDDTWVTLFTSGSTGAPVALPKRLAQLDAELRALQQAFGARLPADVRILTTVSHQHIYGLLFTILWPLAAGRAIPQSRLAFLEELVSQCAADPRPAILVSSPAHLRRMPAGLDWTATRGVLRAVFSSGGPLPAEASADVLRLAGVSPIEVFGSSETGGIAWRQRQLHNDAWTPLPDVAWRLQDGHLAVRSAHLADDDWYVCADRALPTQDGGFVLAGRADRIVKIEEKRISLTAVEQRLATSPLVREARVAMIATAVGERVGAVVVLDDAGQRLLDGAGRPAVVRALRQCLAPAVDPLALPRRWVFPRELPANAQGKTTDAMLRELFRHTVPAVRWVAADATSAQADLDIADDLAVFDGHFPGMPVVPGVAQVDWVMALAPERLAIPPRERFARLDMLKFQAVIRPGTRVRLALAWQPAECVLGFRLTSDAGPHASGKIVFHPDAS